MRLNYGQQLLLAVPASNRVTGLWALRGVGGHGGMSANADSPIVMCWHEAGNIQNAYGLPEQTGADRAILDEPVRAASRAS
jgi:hypothetical protein